MSVVWNVQQARYRDSETGRFVSRNTVLELLRQSMDEADDEIELLAAKVFSKEISIQDFANVFRREIKDEFLRQYITGRGGLGSMTASDWGRVGRALQTQYKFAAGFEADIADMSEAAIANRAGMYVQAAYSAFQMGQREAYKASGQYFQEYWELGDSEHCDDCERLNSLGWVDIGSLPTVPRAGSTACLTSCNCNIRYR